MKHLRYLWYVVRHRWFVMVECFRVGLYWRGLIHDLSKFSAGEWGAYADHFYGRRRGTQRDATGYYKPADTGDPAFDLAWLHHANHNDHHWQYWVQPHDRDARTLPAVSANPAWALTSFTLHPMSSDAVLEMVCDWRGASRAQGHGRSVHEWYERNGMKMLLDPATRVAIGHILSRDDRHQGP